MAWTAGIQSALLLLRHREGDRTALPELFTLWERPLLYYLRRLLSTEEDAWDALQETWVRAVREQHRLRDERAFPAWLYAIARRVAWRTRQRAQPNEPLPGDEEPGALPAAAESPELPGFDAIDLHRALAALSLPHREALTLHFLEGFSIAEIGTITGAAEGTVKSRLFHARQALRARLQEGRIIMNDTHLRDALLAAEPPSPDLERRFRERLLALTHRPIAAAERIMLVMGLLGAVATAAWMVWLLVTTYATARPIALIALPVGFAFCVGWAWLAVTVLRRGTEDRFWDNLVVTRLAGFFTLALTAIMLWDGLHLADPARGNQRILFGLVFWTTIGLPFYVAQFVRENELRVRTDLLHLELAIARRDGVRS